MKVASKGSSVEDVWNWHIATLFLLSSLPLPTKADMLLNAARGRAASLPRSGLEHFPEKWTPVFRRKCDHVWTLERFPIQPNRKAL
jgi:hypothetical protein